MTIIPSRRIRASSALEAARSRRWLLRQAAASAGAAYLLHAPLAAVAAPLAVSGDEYGFPTEPAAHDGGTSVIQLQSESTGFNPVNFDGYTDGAVWGPAGLMFEPLVGRHPKTGEFFPLLASGWETSDDGLTWTFTLRDGVTWHDGTPLTAADVVYTFETMALPEVNSYGRALVVDTIAGIEAPDEQTVVMTATRVNSEFLNVALEWIAPAHIFADVAPADLANHPGTTGEDPSLVVGTGPFRFVERVPQDHTTLQRYENYWGGRPHLESIVFQYAPDMETSEPLLRTAEHDHGWVTFQAADEFQTLDNVTLHQYFSLDLVQFACNLDPRQTTLFQDKRVRQAMLYALDRQAIVDGHFLGHAALAETPLLPTMWTHDPDGIEIRYPYDAERAAQLLEEAGWTLGGDGVREKDGQKFAFTVPGHEYWEPMQSIAQEFWRQVGLDMDLQLMPWEGIDERVVNYDFDMVILYLSCRGTGYPGMFELLYSENFPEGGNYIAFSNPRADELLGMIEAELDPEQRIPLFTELQNLYLDDLPYLPIAHDFDNRAVSNRLHNLYPNPYRTVFNAETWWLEP